MKHLLACLLACLPAAAPAAILPAPCDRLQMSGAPVACAQLRVVRFSWRDFDGALHDDGEVMVLAAAAPHVEAIFEALRRRGFPLAGARLVAHYGGDDARSMRANNTSAFNHRPVTGGSQPSLHAYGLAIDLNPVQNPYVSFERDQARFQPPAGSRYANRLPHRPGKNPRPGMAEETVELFAEHGFMVWGGNWDAPIDYQHFQVSRALAQQLAALPEAPARALFERYVERYRECRRNAGSTYAQCAALGEKPLR